MPTNRHPRIVGFDVPPLKDTVDVVRDAPVVALLDMVPSQTWTDTFTVEAASVRAPLAAALLSVEEDRILFFANAQDSRICCNAVRSLVEKVTMRVVAGDAPSSPVVSNTHPVVRAGAKHVLVVEDDEDLREVACGVLNSAGWQASSAAGVAQALAALEAGIVDAVVTDIDLDERGDGLALAHAVRSRWPCTGLVIVTGRHAEGALDIPEGAIFLAKPYQRRQLLAVLELLGKPA
ncbi:response regulator [Luteibacter aegosomaticola]|uniref:response regulator n=1 Tax=Luteibacter aegosomaticola TaxID=2911538 RepID=UPI001FF8B66E|nr:response regulator [Luteibacter aegosomaticola]UPG88208.1 response regulator [Luteibacter aegosomaticola]